MIRRLLVAVVAVVTVVVGCGTPSKPPVRPDPDGSGAGSGSGSSEGSAVVSDAPTEPECDTLLAHLVQLAVAERPADQQINAAEQKRMRDEMRGEHLAKCRLMRRSKFACGLDAPNLAAFKACDE